MSSGRRSAGHDGHSVVTGHARTLAICLDAESRYLETPDSIQTGIRLDSLARVRASVETRSESAPRRGVLDDAAAMTHRKPVLSLRLSGAFLLRFAARTLAGLLFQPPPRRTR